MSEQLWYAAYGSNLLRERLRCYIVGDQAPGCDKRERGCRDQQPPADERARFLPHRLAFAGSAASWQRGGVAFLDPEPDTEAQTLSRLYLLSAGQFADVVRQENGVAEAAVDVEAALRDGHWDLDHGRYARVLHLGEQDGLPIVTCTCPGPTAALDLHPPSAAYLRCVIAGLRETFALNKQGVKRYLRDLPGIKDRVDGAIINRCFQEAEELLDADDAE